MQLEDRGPGIRQGVLREGCTLGVRVGLDIVPLGRIERSLNAHYDAFVRRVLTEKELSYCEGRQVVERVAGRVAAKEAVMKVLGEGWPRVPWTDIEILPGKGGRPVVHMGGKALQYMEGLGLSSVDVSITHDGGLAIAVALGLAQGSKQVMGIGGV